MRLCVPGKHEEDFVALRGFEYESCGDVRKAVISKDRVGIRGFGAM